MAEKRIRVWVQHFADREYLMLQWLDPDTGKRKSKSAGTNNPLEAENRRCDLEADLNAGRYHEASKLTWEQFRQLFEAEFVATRRTANTRRNYRRVLDLFEKVCSPKTIASVNQRTVSAFRAGLLKLPGRTGETMQPSTVKMRMQFFHTVLQWAADQKFIPSCPHFDAVKIAKKKPAPVPVETFERLLAKAPDAALRAFLLCGWLAGLRRNEALALEWEATDKAPYLDPARHLIVFPAEVVKGAEDQWVPLDPELWDALDALPRIGKKVFHFEPRDGRHAGSVAVTSMSTRVADLARAAGVKLTYKSLRRGFGCRLAAKVPAQVLQRLMRHASIATTMAFYANVDEAAMEAILGKRSPERNRKCNKAPSAPPPAASADDGNPCEERTLP
jgi:integrase